MPALYELVGMREILDRVLEENEGELTPDLERALEALQGETEDKIEKVALYIREQLGDADAIKAEEDRLMKRRHSIVKATSSLREYLKRNMETLGIKKMVGVKATVSLRDDAPIVVGELTQEELAFMRHEGAEFVTFTPATYGIDRKALNLHARGGGRVPAGMHVVCNRSLAIR